MQGQLFCMDGYCRQIKGDKELNQFLSRIEESYVVIRANTLSLEEALSRQAFFQSAHELGTFPFRKPNSNAA